VAQVAPQYFRIQTAMMSTLARAIMAKLDIEEKTGVTHEIQYNARWDNYRVFSTEIQGLDNALAAINALRKSQFSDAFIISEQIFATEDIFYAVQVGAFADESSAQRHVAEIKSAYGLTGHIQFDALTSQYKVVLEPMSNFLTASTERERVRRETAITDAFLITQPNVNARDIEFSVQFGMFDTQAQAFQLSQRLTNRQGVQNYVVQLGGKYYVRSRPTNRLEDAVNLYRRALTLGYSDAIIHTVRS
jgi:cell division protein FtsN